MEWWLWLWCDGLRCDLVWWLRLAWLCERCEGLWRDLLRWLRLA